MTPNTCYLHGSRVKPLVAITFDDGPNPPLTDDVLEILQAANARATFFLIGRWIERWPRTAERILEHGHEIGNHTYLHRFGVGDYDRAERVIVDKLACPTRFARAPSFDYESCGQSDLVRSGRLTLVDAEVNPADWDCDDPNEIARRVLDHPLLRPGSIVDLHDGCDRDDRLASLARPAATVAALPIILRGLAEMGLHTVRLRDLPLDAPVPIARLQRSRLRRRARDAAKEAVS